MANGNGSHDELARAAIPILGAIFGWLGRNIALGKPLERIEARLNRVEERLDYVIEHLLQQQRRDSDG